MNGVRSIYMRKGYLLTALAAAVLLAASSGRTCENDRGPQPNGHGRANWFWRPGPRWQHGHAMGEFDETGQVNDAGIVSNPRVTLTFAENTGSADRIAYRHWIHHGASER